MKVFHAMSAYFNGHSCLKADLPDNLVMYF